MLTSVGAIFLFLGAAQAQVLTWSPGGVNGGSGNWDTSTLNWNSGTLAWSNTTPPEDAAFGGTAGTVSLTAPISAGNLTFNTNGYTLSAGQLTLAGTGGSTITVAAGSAATINSLMTGTAPLIKSGTGQLNIANIGSSYSAGTIISQGTIVFGLGATPSSVNNFLGTGAITLGDAKTSTNNVALLMNYGNFFPTQTVFGNNILVSNLAGGQVTIGSTFFNPGSNGSQYSGIITLQRDVTLQGGNSDRTTYIGKITGTGNITITGGRTTFQTGGTNNFVGSLTISSGATLQLSGANELPATTDVVINTGGQLDTANPGANQTIKSLSGAGNFLGSITGHAGTLTLGANNGSGTFSGIIQNGGGVTLVKTGTGTQTLSGLNTYQGTTTINGGILSVAKLANGGLASGIGGSTNAAGNLVLNGGALQYIGAGASTDRLFSVGTSGGTIDASGTGALILTNTGSIVFNGQSGARTLTLTGTNASANTLSSILGDNGGSTTLTKSGPGTWVLTGVNTYTGGTSINDGTLQVSADGNLGATSGGISFNGGTLHATANIASARTVTLNTGGGTFDTDSSTTLTLSGAIGGSGSLTKVDTGTLLLTGNNSYTGTTTIAAGILQLGNGGTSGTLGTGATINNSTLAFDRSDTVTYAGAISGAGALQQIGSGTTVLTGTNSYTGGTTITAGTLQLGDGTTSGAIVGNVLDNATLAFDPATPITFGGIISGTGVVTQTGTGTTVLTGANSYMGTTAVNAGSLYINGNQSAAVGQMTVNSGGTLGGTGTVGGNVVVTNGGSLNPGGTTNAPGTLTINGNLQLANSSTLNYNFGQAGVVGGPLNDLTAVGGNLTLGGTINVTTSGGGSFDPGVYRVISYAGTLTNNGLSVGTIPSANYFVQTSIDHQVNLVNTNGLTLNFWDGDAGPKNNSIVDGGNGSWHVAGVDNNWTDISGVVNAPYSNGAFAIFSAAPGTVTVDDTAGVVSASGIQFASNGYAITGDTITLVGPQSIIRVGDGTAAGAGYTATIASVLTGGSALVKTDLGALVLTGANTYTGGTIIGAGTLQLGNGGASGSIVGDVADNASLVFNRSDSVSFGGVISGTGAVTQSGTGTTVMTGANSYTGATTINGGILLVNGDQTAATGTTTVSGGAMLGGTGTVGGDVVVANGGTLAPGSGGPGTLNINGSLLLNSGSVLSYELGQANTVGGALNDLTNVAGNLTLDGTLNVTQSTGGTFGPGIYRIINYAGTLTDNGLNVGTIPSPSYFVQTSIAHQVNLVNTDGLTLNYWDGDAGPKNNNTVDGGNGSWHVAGVDNNWTDMSGVVNAPYSNGAFAVFSAAPGTVTVDDTAGAVSVTGMQFTSNGYIIAGDAITLVGPQSIIRVGDGTATGAGYTATIASVLTGSSDLVKTDLGTLVLTGANAYTGGTTVSSGTLIGSATSFGSGAISDNAALVIAQPADATFANAINGGGSFTKQGAARLTYTGAAALTGPTTVAAGTLVVNGSLASSAVTVQSGAVLGGNGTVGATNVLAGGTIAPGFTGSLNVNGAFSQAAGSTYQVLVDPNSNASDLVRVQGRATLASGADLVVTKTISGDYHLGTVYTVLTASNGINGTYALGGDITSVSSFLALKDSYNANNVYLTVIQTRNIQDLGGTSNQVSTGEGVGSLPNGSPVTTAILNLPSDNDARSALDRLSGDSLVSIKSIMMQDARYVRDAALGRARDMFCATGDAYRLDDDIMVARAATGCAPASNKLVLWAQGYGAWGGVGTNGNAAGINHTTAGFLVGVDAPVWDWRAGIFGGRSITDYGASARNMSAESTEFHLGTYAGHQWGALDLGLGASYTWDAVDSTRPVALGNFSNLLGATYNTGTTQTFGELGYDLSASSVDLQPFVSLAYVSLHTGGFTETGGDAALTGQAGTMDNFMSTLGVRSSMGIDLGPIVTTLKGMLGWQHTYGDIVPIDIFSFTGGDPFAIAGVPIARDAAAIEAGFDANLTGTVSFGISYGGRFASRTADQSIEGTVRISF